MECCITFAITGRVTKFEKSAIDEALQLILIVRLCLPTE